MSKLALMGGSPVRSKPWPSWPIFDEKEEQSLLTALRSGNWGRLQGTRARVLRRGLPSITRPGMP